MEIHSASGELACLGALSDWAKARLGQVGLAAGLEVKPYRDASEYLAAPRPRNRVGLVLLEAGPELVERTRELRAKGRGVLVFWMGRSFSKDELSQAVDLRVYGLLEGADPDTAAWGKILQRAVGRAQMLERFGGLMFSVKSALLQLQSQGHTTPLTELKTGLSKIERSIAEDEFLGPGAESGAQPQVPFYKAQGFSDALLTVQDLERTGCLTTKVVQSAKVGKVHFLQGRPVGAQCGEARGLKAIYRMFLWDDPVFDFSRLEADEMSMEDQFPLGLREICQAGEGLRNRFDRIRPKLPPMNLRLELKPEALHPKTDFNRDQFSTLSSVVELGKVGQILDYNPLPDVVLYECLIELKKAGVIRVPAA